jgi:2-polyprenyl-3-methyl-5-hydroxy-6-metoxy-1,4-benzoquinol methylase
MVEYFVPIKSLKEYIKDENLGAIHHLIRYRWAVEVLKDINPNTIIDIACGAGYGTYQIGKELPNASVVGVDYDPNAVDYAKNNFSLKNITYNLGNVLSWDFGIFDCIVCFDTIEHISHREIMMENIVNNVNLCLILSTPCGHKADILAPAWDGHKIEYSSASLYRFLSRYFGKIVRPDGDNFPHLNIFNKIDYFLCMNPVVCYNPIRILDNPYEEFGYP